MFFIVFENRLILKYRICYSNLRLNFIKQNSQHPTLTASLIFNVTIMTSR